MSTYDYKCTLCGDVHEEKHGMKEEPQISCPVCSSPCNKHISVVHVDSYWDGAEWEETKFRR